MDDFISKPVNPQALIELIEAYKYGTVASVAFDPSDFDMPGPEMYDIEKQEQALTANVQPLHG